MNSPNTELSTPAIQRLEACLKEIVDCLCYQPEVPLAHKSCLIDAFVAFQNEINEPQRKERHE